MKDYIGSECLLKTIARNATTKTLSFSDLRNVERVNRSGNGPKNHCKNVKNHHGNHTTRMAAASTLLSLASAMPTGSTVGAIPVCDLPNKSTPKPDNT